MSTAPCMPKGTSGTWDVSNALPFEFDIRYVGLTTKHQDRPREPNYSGFYFSSHDNMSNAH